MQCPVLSLVHREPKRRLLCVVSGEGTDANTDSATKQAGDALRTDDRMRRATKREKPAGCSHPIDSLCGPRWMRKESIVLLLR
mmetsp:Transcript_20603/g.43061  ORF Transcript_20603/g.43061 Transcript_20603/m.43061 type:complete len:83 (-) Transcript_20603:239-487(-)